MVNDAHSGRYGGPEDGQDPYAHDPYTQQYYDPYADPPPEPAPEPPYDPYAQPLPPPQQQPQYDQYGRPYGPYPDQQQQQQPGYDYDAYAQQQYATPAPPQAEEPQQWVPQQQARPPEPAPVPEAAPDPPREPGGGDGGSDEADYRTEQFSFIEEPDDDADDVIDWLKFAETRSERRDERKRKSHNRVVTLIVLLVLALIGGAGYLWYAGKLPGLTGAGQGTGETAGGAQKRDVIIVHLRDTKGAGSSTALLVNNETTGKGTTVLLPNSLAVSGEDTSTTLGSSVEEEGNGPTRDALNTLLGSKMEHSWRLDTPYLENLVELVGGITVDTDAAVPGPKKGDDPLAKQGKDQALDGRAAVGYATLLRDGETQTDQLLRFGQVMRATLRKLPSDPETATTTVRNLNQIADPSLTEGQLGASLAQLAEQAKSGAYETELLPVRSDGTLSDRTAESVVKDVLGGTVKNADPDATPRVSVRNATGGEEAAGAARVTLVNGGYTFVDGGSADAAVPASRVTYADPAQAAKAKEIAITLGLPESAVVKGKGPSNADVTVVLGQDYGAAAGGR